LKSENQELSGKLVDISLLADLLIVLIQDSFCAEDELLLLLLRQLALVSLVEWPLVEAQELGLAFLEVVHAAETLIRELAPP
jgi:hypothetical protein